MILLLGLLACLERTTGEDKPLDERFLQTVGETQSGAPVLAGPTVMARGVVESALDHGVDLDVSVSDPASPGGRRQLGKSMLDGPGSFEVSVPANQAGVVVVVFQDLQGDGPSAEDPYAALDFDTQGADVEGLVARLEVGAFGPSKVEPAPPGAPGGDPSAPPAPAGAPGGGPPPTGQIVERDLFAGRPGSRVTLRGEVDSPAGLPVELVVFAGDEANEVGALTLAGPGPFEIKVPRGVGKLRLRAGQDLDGGGVAGGDPVAARSVQVGEVDVDGLLFTLSPAAGSAYPPRAARSGEGADPAAAAPTHEGAPVGRPPEVPHVVVAPGGPGATTAGVAGPFDSYAGPVVVVSGQVVANGPGLVDLDLRQPDDDAPGGVKALGKLFLKEPGPFAFKVPQGLGELRIEAFQDLQRDGPDDADPWAAALVDVGAQDIAGTRLMLVAGARGGAAEHREVSHSVAGEGAQTKVSFEHVGRPVDPGAVGPFANHQGAMVALRGEVRAPSADPVDIDVWIDDPAAPGGRRNQGKIILVEPGPFRIRVPRSAGRIRLEAFQDADADGPGPKDPFALVDVEVKGAAVEGLVLELSTTRRADAGAARPAPVDRLPFADEEGPRVRLAGQVKSDRVGPVSIDFRVPDAAAPGGVARVGQITLPTPGPFEVKIPRGKGELELEAFQDMAGDGPDDADPYGRVRVEVAKADLQVRIELVEGGRAALAAAGPAAAVPSVASGPGDPFPGQAGERVVLAGTLSWEGTQLVDVDFFRVDEAAPGGRSIAGKVKLPAGPFELRVPAGLGPVIIEAYVDLEGDGPSASDPAGRYEKNPLTIGEKDLRGVDIRVVATP